MWWRARSDLAYASAPPGANWGQVRRGLQIRSKAGVLGRSLRDSGRIAGIEDGTGAIFLSE